MTQRVARAGRLLGDGEPPEVARRETHSSLRDGVLSRSVRFLSQPISEVRRMVAAPLPFASSPSPHLPDKSHIVFVQLETELLVLAPTYA